MPGKGSSTDVASDLYDTTATQEFEIGPRARATQMKCVDEEQFSADKLKQIRRKSKGETVQRKD